MAPVIKRPTAAVADEPKSNVMNVKLTLGTEQNIYGELSIGDFLIGDKNRTMELGQKPLVRLGQDIEFDHWAYYLNNMLRETVHEYLVQKSGDKKETLKRIVKEVDDRLYPELITNGKWGQFSLLHAMYYSFLEPVKIMTNNMVKALLPKMRD